MLNRHTISRLTPVELELLSGYIHKMVMDRVNTETDNHDNLDAGIKCCPHCGSVHFVKNGFNPKHRQKYLCRDCKKIFVSTTGTIFSRSRISYCDWTGFIACEVNGLTLEQESVAISRSIATCFSMRHTVNTTMAYSLIQKCTAECIVKQRYQLLT